jgi:Zn finger protein HypA/HybF involved in hydrogenase expression
MKEEFEKNKSLYDYSLVNFEQIKNNTTTILIICLKCKELKFEKYVFEQKILVHFTMKCGCPRCGKSMSWNYERVLEYLNRLPKNFTDNFIYKEVDPEKITHGRSKLLIVCKHCRKDFKKSITNHITMMRGCPHCNSSEASKMVYSYLKENKIEFEEESSIKGPEGTNYRYDYKLFLGEDVIILELDGKQHFSKNSRFHKIENSFEKARERDIYKHQKALDNKYKIIRIDYTVSLIDIAYHLEKAIKSDKKEYFSNENLYDWLKI